VGQYRTHLTDLTDLTYCVTVTAGLRAVIVKLSFRSSRNSYVPGVVGIVTVHVRVVTPAPTHVHCR